MSGRKLNLFLIELQKQMTSSAISIRFNFISSKSTKVSVKWCVDVAECIEPKYNSELLLEKDDSYSYSGDLLISAEQYNKVFFIFNYDNDKYTKPNDYLITNSLQDSLLITEHDEEFDKNITLRFKINYQTYYGQILYVVGSLPELGHWNIKKGLRLYHSNSPPSLEKQSGLFTDNKFNWQCDLEIKYIPKIFCYRYVVVNECSTPYYEPGNIRKIIMFKENEDNLLIELNDVWRWNELSQSLFSKRLFDEMLFVRKSIELPTDGGKCNDDSIYCTFHAHCGVVGRSRKLFVVGSIEELGNWHPNYGIPLMPSTDLQWSAKVIIKKNHFPFEFKFIAGEPGSVVWETYGNRVATVSNLENKQTRNVIIDSWHINFPNLSFHGAGVVINVDILNTFDFNLLNNIIDWSSKVGFASIHIYGIYDTTAMTNEFDQLPVSGFAINPLYIDLSPYGFIPSSTKRNDLIKEKLNFIRELWNKKANEFDIKKFKEDNQWLKNYEKLCYSRSIGKIFYDDVPEDFANYVDFTQYLCYSQISHAVEHSLSLNIAIGCEIKFAVSEKSAEAYYQQDLFFSDYYLGVAPSEQNPIGEILPAYPYNFKNAEDWFRKRVLHFSAIFSMIKLESTISFFRQWIVPRATCVRAVFGHFEPSANVSYAELETWGLWDIERYTHPFIRMQLLNELFGSDALKIRKIFLNEQISKCGSFLFKEQFLTEKSILESSLPHEEDELRKKYINQLLRLIGEILLIKVGNGEYQPRLFLQYAPTEKPYQPSFSFSQLPTYYQQPFLILEDELVNNKQRTLWLFNGKHILQHITAVSDSTFISDASGMDGELCDEALQSVGVLPMRVQMEGRYPNSLFDDIRGYPFLSIAIPQNSSIPLRNIWKISSEKAEKLWKEEFWESEESPKEYTDEVAMNIMKQHCWSGSMWALFPIDSLIGTSEYFTKSDHSKYETLNINEYLKDSNSQNQILNLLNQTQRK